MLFKLPDLGEGLHEAEIVQWHVVEGDSIALNAAMVSVETDKAIVDIPSPVAGRIVKLYAGAGEIVATGAALVDIQAESDPADTEDSADVEDSTDTRVADDAVVRTSQDAPHRTDSGTVVGEVPSTSERWEEPASTTTSATALNVRATPAVRALAHRHGIDLALVTPTGRDDTITSKDVERAAKRLQELGPQEQLKGARRAMAMAMQRAHSEVVPATIMDDAVVEHFTAGVDISVRLIRAMQQACTLEPSLNAWYDSHATGRRVFKHVDLAMAMDTPDGLFTPVLRDVVSLGDDELREQIETFKQAIGDRTIAREDLRDATITLSNFGTIAGRYAAPVVMPPTVAILGIGKIEPRVVVVSDEMCIRRLMSISLTFDHRAVTGGEAGRFLQAFINAVEQ